MKKIFISAILGTILALSIAGTAAFAQDWPYLNPAGNVTGNVNGNVTGNANGNITGNINGNAAGNNTGNVTGNITGNITGNVTGNVTAPNITPAMLGNMTLHDYMRKLWTDHSIWTRQVIVDVSGNLPSTNASVARILKNQEDIGNLFGLVYGSDTGNNLTSLLKVHINTAYNIVAAAKAGNQTGFAAENATWYANGDDIATLLNTVNQGNWPLADAKAMFKTHLDLVMSEAVARLTGNYDGDTAAFDQAYLQALMMADMLTNGIMAQFPETFGNGAASALMSPGMMNPGGMVNPMGPGGP